MKKINSGEFIGNTLWKTIETVSTKLVSLVISTILARIIAPEAYGIFGLVTVFVSPFEGYLNCVNQAVFCNNKSDEKDLAGALVINISLGILIYGALFLGAPYIAKLYQKEQFCNILRALAVILLFQSVVNVAKTKATMNLQTKLLAISAFISGTLSGLLGIYMAYHSYGVWSLVAQSVSYVILDTFIVVVITKWKPSFKSTKEKYKKILKDGMHFGLSQLVSTLNVNICSIIGGRVYNSEDLGYNSKGISYAEIIGLYIFGTLNSFSLMAVSSRQDNIEEVKIAVRKIMTFAVYVMAPVMIGLLSVADTLIPLWLTDIWAPAIPYFKLACITYLIYPISTISSTVLRGLGKHSVCTKLAVLSMFANITNSVIVTLILRKPLIIACITGQIVNLCFLILHISLFKKYVGYSFKEILSDIYQPFVFSLILYFAVQIAKIIPCGAFISLILQILSGALIYILASVICKNQSFNFLWNLIKTILNKKLKKG